MLTNKHHTVLYIGVTSNLQKRVYEHKQHIYKNSFTDKYNIETLVHYETYPNITAAIEREKVIKKWRREKKDALINERNPEWKELYDNEQNILLHY